MLAGFTKCVVEVETGNGLTGIAEAPGPASARLSDSVSPVLVGAPLGITGLGRWVLPSMPAAHSVTGYGLRAAFGAVEIALWDLHGKLWGQPVANLLGRVLRRRIPFADPFGYRLPGEGVQSETSVPDIVPACLALRAAHGTTWIKGKISDFDLCANIALLSALHEVLGPGSMPRIARNQAFSLSSATNLAPAFQDLGVCNWEDPTADRTQMRKLRAQTPIPFSGHNAGIGKAGDQDVPDAVASDVAGLGGFAAMMRFVSGCQARCGDGRWSDPFPNPCPTCLVRRNRRGLFMQMRKSAQPARTITPAEAAALVQSGMWIDYCSGILQPDVFDAALAADKDRLRDVKIRSTLTTRPRAVLEQDPDGAHFHSLSLHFSGYDRRMHDAGRTSYLPVNLGEVPDYYRRFIPPVDILILKTCRMDADGMFNFSGLNLWHREIVLRAKCVIVEVTDGLPYAHGPDNGVHVSEVDYILEGDNSPATELPNPLGTEVDRAVAHLISEEIEDGACLQIGIGGMPNAVCSELLHSTARDLGVHTEMLTDGIVDLYLAGRINGSRKTLMPGKVVYSFALGSRKLYDAIHRNPDFAACPVDFTNLPHNIMANDRVVSINNTTQIDLQGQCASESDGFRHISGTGGQLQFVRGAYASTGGKSFICLSSTYSKRGEPKSRIVLSLTPGNIVTTPRSDVMYVVTEYGMVNLKGKSVPERAMALISIAHPDFREGLLRQAHEGRIIPRGFTF